MADYKRMYYLLCRAVSEALDALPESRDTHAGREALQNALYQAEDIYIDTSEPFTDVTEEGESL